MVMRYQQLSLFPNESPHKYIIDTSSLISQKPNERHPRETYQTLWEKIDFLISSKVIVLSKELKDEISDKEIKAILSKLDFSLLSVDEEIQELVTEVVSIQPKLLSFTQGTSSGDAFLIATAKSYSLTVITEENKDKPNKIPQICKSFHVPCVNILGLCKNEGWKF